MDKEELEILKKISLSNTKLISILTFFFHYLNFNYNYFLQSILKLKILLSRNKNKYSKDNKYLAVVTENGLWIRDKIDNKVNIINSDSLDGNILKNVTINQFSQEYQIYQNIVADEVNIEKNIWIIKQGKLSENNTKFKSKRM